jgi:mannose-6-phosphate isomerase-like protein (cupin superfamily)
VNPTQKMETGKEKTGKSCSIFRPAMPAKARFDGVLRRRTSGFKKSARPIFHTPLFAALPLLIFSSFQTLSAFFELRNPRSAIGFDFAAAGEGDRRSARLFRGRNITMNEPDIRWTLGHRTRLFDTEEEHGLIGVISAPRAPGPHFHRDASEVFFIVSGQMDILQDGEWRRLTAGGFSEVPVGAVHTFINNGTEDVLWVTGCRPQGVDPFFRDFGIPWRENDAREQSVSPETLERLGREAERYGMILSA